MWHRHRAHASRSPCNQTIKFILFAPLPGGIFTTYLFVLYVGPFLWARLHHFATRESVTIAMSFHGLRDMCRERGSRKYLVSHWSKMDPTLDEQVSTKLISCYGSSGSPRYITQIILKHSLQDTQPPLSTQVAPSVSNGLQTARFCALHRTFSRNRKRLVYHSLLSSLSGAESPYHQVRLRDVSHAQTA